MSTRAVVTSIAASRRRVRRLSVNLIASLVFARASVAIADDAGAPADDEPIASATSSHLDRRDLDERPHLQATDLLRYLPGLAALQPGAAGEADQLLVRGFDAGQGANLAIYVDGIPINLSSHAAAHGYADPHFLIADAVGSIDLHEGAYAARYGEFGTAGTLELHTLDAVPRGGARVRLTSGTEAGGLSPLKERLKRLRYQLVGMVSPELDRGSALLAAEVGVDDGPDIHPQRFRRGAVLGKWRRPIGNGELVAAIQFYSGRWFESGYLSASEVSAHRLTPFSAADPSQGGAVARGAASLSYTVRDARGRTWQLAAYAVDSDLRLYKNPTLFLRDPDHGDQIEYVDHRTYYGIDGSVVRPYRPGRALRGHLRLGVQTRSDAVESATWHDERRLRRPTCFAASSTNPCTDTSSQIRDVSTYAENMTSIGKRVRIYAGVRLGEQIWNVDDRDADTMLGPSTLGGTGARARVSPKFGVIVHGDTAELSALAGSGAYTTDARAAAAASGYGAFVRTYNAELGARVYPDPRLSGAIALWASQVAPYETWSPETSDGVRAPETRRHGIETKLVFAPTPWLSFDAALAVSRGSTRPDDGSPHLLLPLAPRLIGGAGLAVRRGPGFASLRVRALGPRATDDAALHAAGYTLVDVVAGRRFGAFELGLTIDNLLDASWREAQFASDVRTSRRVEPIRDLLITTGMPRTVLVTLGYAP
jgi:hypothetical protein